VGSPEIRSGRGFYLRTRPDARCSSRRLSLRQYGVHIHPKRSILVHSRQLGRTGCVFDVPQWRHCCLCWGFFSSLFVRCTSRVLSVPVLMILTNTNPERKSADRAILRVVATAPGTRRAAGSVLPSPALLGPLRMMVRPTARSARRRNVPSAATGTRRSAPAKSGRAPTVSARPGRQREQRSKRSATVRTNLAGTRAI
jgi:hypothetical protein